MIEMEGGDRGEGTAGEGECDGDFVERGVAEDSGGEGFGGDAEAELFFDERDDEVVREVGGEDDFGGDEE